MVTSPASIDISIDMSASYGSEGSGGGAFLVLALSSLRCAASYVGLWLATDNVSKFGRASLRIISKLKPMSRTMTNVLGMLTALAQRQFLT